LPEPRLRVVRRRARRLVADQQFERHLARKRGSLAVCPFVPGVGRRTQKAASILSPSISTVQARQLPGAR
jgi:hypothetical protein